MRAIFFVAKTQVQLGILAKISNLQTNVSGFQPMLAKGCLGHSEDNSDVNAMNHILGAGVPSPRLKLPIMQAACRATQQTLLSFFQFTSHFHHFHWFSSSSFAIDIIFTMFDCSLLYTGSYSCYCWF